jgi:hypothetical protein
MGGKTEVAIVATLIQNGHCLRLTCQATSNSVILVVLGNAQCHPGLCSVTHNAPRVTCMHNVTMGGIAHFLCASDWNLITGEMVLAVHCIPPIQPSWRVLLIHGRSVDRPVIKPRNQNMHSVTHGNNGRSKPRARGVI